MCETKVRRVARKVSALDIRRSYTNEKARIDLTAHLWIYLVLRPISFCVTPLFINLGFSANTVTVLGLLPLVSGLVLLALGAVNYSYSIVGAVLVNIWLLFDCIDGDVARFRGQISKFGALLDFIVGLIYHVFLPVCLGLTLYWGASERSMTALGLEFPRWVWLVAGAVELFAGLLRKVVSLQYQSGVGEQDRKQGSSRITIWTVLPRAILSFKAPALLIASLFGSLGFFLLGYAVYNLIVLFTMTVLSLRRALLFDWQQLDEGDNL